MTELQALLTFIVNLFRYPGQVKDAEGLARRLRTIVLHSDFPSAARLAASLLAFDDAIVWGLNSGKFIAIPTDSLSCYPNSCLPKFLFGLSSQVFDPESGLLLERYSVKAIDALLTCLRLVRRCSIPGTSASAEDLAISEFIDRQMNPESPDAIDLDVAEAISDCWGYFTEGFEDKPTIGFPGNGVTSDMSLPYVPKLSFVDPESLPSSLRLPFYTAYQHLLPRTFEVTSPCNLINIYPFIPYEERVATLSVVPKSFKVGRAITVTNTSSVIIGATLRETCWDRARELGIIDFVNVHNQRGSHNGLFKFFFESVQRDLRGGSTCYAVWLQLQYLSKSRFARNCFNHSRPSAVEYKERVLKWFVDKKMELRTRWKREKRVVDVTTLTMGDSSCTALLTLNLFFKIVLAIAYRDHVPYGARISRQLFFQILETMKREYEGRINVVGDDVRIPAELRHFFDRIAVGQGVVINERKSSNENSIHKETCGCWAIRGHDNTITRIYPFRAPQMTGNLTSDLSALHAAASRTRGSRFSFEILVANAAAFSHLYDYFCYEAYNDNQLGSPLGTRKYERLVEARPPRSIVLPDDVGLAFRFRDSKTTARTKRRPTVERGRLVHYRDKAIPERAGSISQKEVQNRLRRSSNDAVVATSLAIFIASFLHMCPGTRHSFPIHS